MSVPELEGGIMASGQGPKVNIVVSGGPEGQGLA